MMNTVVLRLGFFRTSILQSYLCGASHATDNLIQHEKNIYSPPP
jgi:hypothetical protein